VIFLVFYRAQGPSTSSLGGSGDDMPLSAAQKKLTDVAEAHGYLPTYRSIIREMCASFWWHGHDEQGKHRILQNGTVCFVDTGHELIAVTAAHVLNGYIAERRAKPDIVCQLGNITYDPEHHVIDIDTHLDLATFKVSAVVIAGAGCSPSRPLTWPPAPVAIGDVLLCGGHPGAIRQERESIAEMPFQWFLATAAASNENIGLSLELNDCYVPRTHKPLSNQELGGMSGGPVFKYIRPAPIERIELVGFIYEFQQTLGLMFARPAKYIDEQGQINATAA
jgi:hypothetical protein